jgi:hypothetical protein
MASTTADSTRMASATARLALSRLTRLGWHRQRLAWLEWHGRRLTRLTWHRQGSLGSANIDKDSFGSDGIGEALTRLGWHQPGSLGLDGMGEGSLDVDGIDKAHLARMTSTKAHSAPMA